MIDRLFISFSGGETSAYMTKRLLSDMRGRFRDYAIVFANTGQENEETLEFVDRCDKAYGWNVVWVEAVVHHGERKGSTHKIVSFETASRNGEPFEEVIKKYGIPNMKFPHCTRELKKNAMRSYMASIGWEDYWIAVGIRADEMSRCSETAVADQIIYPLAHWSPTTKPGVNTHWRDQPFRLELAGYNGNCKSCWKKSTRKLLTVMDENPAAFDFPDRMERLYGRVGPEFEKPLAEGYKRVFFRKNLSAQDLKAMHSAGGWDRAENDAVIYLGDKHQLDLDDGCVDSCEIDFAAEVTL